MNTRYTAVVFSAVIMLFAAAGPVSGSIELHKRIDLSAHSVKNCRLSIGDLNGDGEIDFLFNDGRRVLKAFDSNGGLLWEKINLQDPGVEEKYHNFTLSVYDITRDGKDEVMCFLEIGGEHHLAVLEGATGTVIASVQLPFDAPRDHEYWGNNNYYMQNHTAIANLRGLEVPQDILAMHASKQKVAAYAWQDGTLSLMWYWVSDADSYASGHYSYPYDIDNDGKDEVISGVDVLDSDGRRLWKMQLHPWKPSRPDWGMDHVDALACADIRPDIPGNEIAVAAATGMWLYTADGEVIWHYPSKITDPENGVMGAVAGIQEVLVGHFRPDTDALDLVFYSEYMSGSETVGLFNSSGERLRSADQADGPRRVITYAIDWDGDRSTDEIYSRKGIYNHNFQRLDYTMNWGWVQTKDTDEFPPIVCDVQGDHREEIIWYDEDEILIIKNSAPLTVDPLPSPREDIQYRLRYANNNHCNAYFYDWRKKQASPPLKGTAEAAFDRSAAPVEAIFTGSASGGNAPYAYRWDFGDRNSSHEQNPSHLYTVPGSYRAVYTVTDGSGRSAADSVSFAVQPALSCTVSADAISGTVPAEISFSAEASGGVSPYGAAWDFGDGNTSQDVSPVHIYTAPGNYQVVCTLRDSENDVIPDTLAVTVLAELSVQAASGTDAVQTDSPVSFAAHAGGGTGAYSYTWDFGDGTVSDVQGPAHRYTKAGTYVPVVTVHDTDDRTAVDSLQITVYAPLTAAADARSTAAPGEEITFTGAAEGGLGDWTCSWDFGDGTTMQQTVASHAYAAEGVFSAVFRAEDSEGNTSADTLTITVRQELSCSAAFASSAAEAPAEITFSAEASGGVPPYNFVWDLGDGRQQSGQACAVFFEEPGDYRIVLDVVDAEGSRTSDSLDVRLAPASSSIGVSGITVTAAGDFTEADRIRADEFYQLNIRLDNPQHWESLSYIDLWMSAPGYSSGTADNRGGDFRSAGNYIISFNIPDRKIYAKQIQSAADWTDVTGTAGTYVSALQGEYLFDAEEGTLQCTFKLLEDAKDGYWTLSAYTSEHNGSVSSVFQNTVYVQSLASTPAAVLEINGPVNRKLHVTLRASAELADIDGALRFRSSDGTELSVSLSATGDRRTYTGVLELDDRIAPGTGTFFLDKNALVDADGNRGEKIISGATLTVDDTPPPKPVNVMINTGG